MSNTVPAPTNTVESTVIPAIATITHCQLDGRPVDNGHCNLTSLEQLVEPNRNLCPCFTFCETRLREKLAQQ